MARTANVSLAGLFRTNCKSVCHLCRRDPEAHTGWAQLLPRMEMSLVPFQVREWLYGLEV